MTENSIMAIAIIDLKYLSPFKYLYKNKIGKTIKAPPKNPYM
jgi:hypothetical protein